MHEIDMEDRKALKAIRLKCLDCSGGSAQEVEQCEVTDCPLHAFRLGQVPEGGLRKKKTEGKGQKEQSINLPGL